MGAVVSSDNFMFNNHNNSGFRDTISLAGWLFADLFLGLAMLFLVFNTIGDEDSLLSATSTSETPKVFRTVTPSPAITLTKPLQTSIPTHPLTPTVKATVPVGLDLVPGFVTVNIVPQLLLSNNSSEIDTLTELLRARFKTYGDRRVGLVITLGYHKEVGSGIALAKKANMILRELYPEMFNGAVMKTFWYSLDENHPAGTITFEVYFFAQVGMP